MEISETIEKKNLGRGAIWESTVFGASAGIVFLAKWLVFGPQEIAGDGAAYLSMANGGIVEPPQSFHVLTPWLAAHIAPSDPSSGFAVIAALSFIGTAICIGRLTRRVIPDASGAERALAIALFIATGTGTMMFRYYCFTDSLSYFLLAAACVAILNNRDWWLMGITLVGIFNRETALFAMPVWFIYNFGRGPWLSLLRRALLVAGPAVVGYYFLHHTTLIFGYDPPHLNYLIPENMLLLWRISISWLGNDNIYLGLAICFFLAFGPVWFLALCGLISFKTGRQRMVGREFIALWGLAIPVIATLMIVDWRRGFQPLFPVLTVAAVFGIRLWSIGPKRVGWWVISAATVAASAICAEAWWYPPMRIPVSIAAVIWVFGICFGSYLERGEKLNEQSKASDGGIISVPSLTGSSDRLNIWVVLPTYNEALNLPLMLQKLSMLKMEIDILVVDDNSPDGTAKIAKDLATDRTNLHVIHRSSKGGLGSAYVDGFLYALNAGADAVITMDCDLSHQPEELPVLIDNMGSAGVIVGSRYVSGGKIVNWPRRRLMLSAAANRFVRILFAMPIKDCTSGFRVYDQTIAKEIVDRMPRSPGYSFQVETLCIANSTGSTIREVPIRFVERVNGVSKMGIREVVSGAFILLSLRIQMLIRQIVGTDVNPSSSGALVRAKRTEP